MMPGLHWIHKTDTEFRYCWRQRTKCVLLTSYIWFSNKVRSINDFSLGRQNLTGMVMCIHFFIPAVFWKYGMTQTVYRSYKTCLYVVNFIFIYKDIGRIVKYIFLSNLIISEYIWAQKNLLHNIKNIVCQFYKLIGLSSKTQELSRENGSLFFVDMHWS
jgi:hypothetical protein